MPSLKSFNTPVEVLHHEMLQEQASALGRLARGLEAALEDLRAFDATRPRPDGPAHGEAAREARHALVAAAGHALWMLAVQREACGLREARGLMRDYKVPPEVQERMGIFPARKGGSL
jgi:hypothetical protein